MAVETSPRAFSFRFSDLVAGQEPPRLTVLESQAPLAPGDVRPLTASGRPRWLPRLRPVFRAGDPLRVAVRATAAPAFGARLVESLASLFAMAGHDAGLQVGVWETGFAVAGHGLGHAGAEPHAQLVVADVEPASIRVAATALEEVPERTRWLVVHGDLEAADVHVGMEAAVARVPAGRAVRLPLFDRSDLRWAGRGTPAGLGRARRGRSYLELAARLVRAYLEEQP